MTSILFDLLRVGELGVRQRAFLNVTRLLAGKIVKCNEDRYVPGRACASGMCVFECVRGRGIARERVFSPYPECGCVGESESCSGKAFPPCCKCGRVRACRECSQ